MVDKVLQRLELENRKAILIASKNKIKIEGIEIKTGRGIYKLSYEKIPYTIRAINLEIDTEIEEINEKLEELTGLNQDHMDYLNNIVEV